MEEGQERKLHGSTWKEQSPPGLNLTLISEPMHDEHLLSGLFARSSTRWE